MKNWIILFTIDLLLYYFISFRMGAIGFVLIFLKIMYDIGLFTPIKFSSGLFKNSEVYYINYTGEYKRIGTEFDKMKKIFKKFNLDKNVYSIFGIYYDNPKVMSDIKKCRASVGILKEISQFSKNRNESNNEMEEYLKENNFLKAELPDTNSLRVTFPYFNMMSLFIGMNKFYKALEKNLNDNNFLRSFRMSSNKVSCTMHVYGEKEIVFYVPLQNNEELFIHNKIG